MAAHIITLDFQFITNHIINICLTGTMGISQLKK